MIAFLASLIALTQQLALSGIVVDPGGLPVPAEIRLEHDTDRRVWSLTASADGTFRIEDLPLGSYKIDVKHEGFFPLETTLHLEIGKTIEFTLAPLERLQSEVSVIARPETINAETASVDETVSDRVIQNLPYTGRRNFLQALAINPGIIKDSLGQIHMHGSRPDQIRYELDGIELSDPATGNLSSNIPIDAIESVDLELVGYSAEFGKASGGVVRARSQFIENRFQWNLTDFVPGVDFRHRSLAEISPRFLVSGPIVKDKAWFLVSSSIRFVQSFNEDLPRGQNKATQTVVDPLIKLQWNLRPASVLTLSGLGSSEYRGNLGLSRTQTVETTRNYLRRSAAIAASVRNVAGRGIYETMVSWSPRRESVLPKGQSMLRVYPDRWEGNYYSSQFGRTNRVHASQQVTLDLSGWRFKQRVKTGVSFDHVRAFRDIDNRAFQILTVDGRLRQIASFDGPTTARLTNREFGAFVQDRVTLHPRLSVEVGARVDRESAVGAWNFSPRAGLVWSGKNESRWKLAAGAGLFTDAFRLENLLLSRLQRRTAITFGPTGLPNDNLEPTELRRADQLFSPRSLNWHVSYEREWAVRWVTRASVISKKGSRQDRFAAVSIPGGFALELGNSGNSDYRAIELALDRPVRSDFRILTSYTHSRSRQSPSLTIEFPDPNLDLTPIGPTAWDAPHRLVSWGYFPFFFKSNAAYALEVRSGFPFSIVDDLHRVVGPYHGRRFPAVVEVGFSIERELPTIFGKRLALRVGATNILNRFNPRFIDNNLDSPTFLRFSDSSGRAFVGRVRLLPPK